MDSLAERLAIRRLSDFGFADDQFGEAVVWHDPEAGLRTISTLLVAAVGENHSSDRIAGAAADLMAAKDALVKAAAGGIPFALIIRVGEDSLQSLYGHGRVGRFG